jgi:hypothetical protein
MKLKIGKPTYAGSGELIHVGSAAYRVCPGARVHRTAGGRLVWVYEYDGSVHCFTEAGEVLNLPESLADFVEDRIFNFTN